MSDEKRNEVNQLMIRVQSAKRYVELADILREMVPHEGAWVSDNIIAKAYQFGEDDMAMRIGKGLASLAVKS